MFEIIVFNNTNQPYKIIPVVIMPNNELESSILDHVSVIGMHSLIRLFLWLYMHFLCIDHRLIDTDLNHIIKHVFS